MKLFELLLISGHLVARAIGIVIEADAGLDAESLAADHLAEQRACCILVVVGLLKENIHDCQADIQSDEVAEFQRAHGVVAAELHAVVDAFDISCAGVVYVDRFIDHRNKDSVYSEACSLIDLYRNLAELLGDLDDLLNSLCGGIDTCNDLNQLHNRSGIEEVHADDGLGKACADLCDG